MFTTRNLIIVIGKNIAFALMGVVVAGVVIFFLNKQIETLTNLVVKNRSLANTLASRTELFTILKRDAEIVGSNDQIIERAFISSDNVLDFVAALESAGLKNSVTQNIRFNSPLPSPLSGAFPVSEISYTSSMSTNILTLNNFLKDFEQLPYFAKIDSISLSAQDKSGWSAATQASIRATLYTKATK